jgi:flagellar biosynthesis/type III secretory pathway protein FliH
MIPRRRTLAMLVLAGGLVLPACATAQPYGRAPGYWGRQDARHDRAWDNGYRAGFNQGRADARRSDRFDYRRHRLYRDGRSGYGSGYGSRDAYRRVFRQGFEAGYRDGFRRYERTVPRRGDVYGRYPGYDPRDRRGGYGYGEAVERGLREGYQKGREDARDRDRYDPRRHKWYREGDRGYDRRDGSRERYKDAYREAFLRGYAQGYREHSRGGWRR